MQIVTDSERHLSWRSAMLRLRSDDSRTGSSSQLVLTNQCAFRTVPLWFLVPVGLSLANIGNDSRTIRKDGEAPVRVVFDLEARRKPQVFAADAVSLWNFNRRLLILKELLLYSTKLMELSYPAHGPSIWHNAASAAPSASFLSPIRTLPHFRVLSGLAEIRK